ncbi:MAG: glycosyltransferase family 2 protein [Gemmatimonadetes bacterium]|nr:glycosyltransferase family 2 protein [Gemmatimonadota bacterium]
MSNRTLPTISLVTPSFNQGAWLDATMRSVLDQRYPALQYVVMDGGSTDHSVTTIERHAPALTHWESQADAGQYDAVNTGFSHTDGEIMGWLNSDDLHTPWTLRTVGELFARFPEVEWISSLFPLFWDADGALTACEPLQGFSRRAMLAGEFLPTAGSYAQGFIQQESTFWRRSLWERAGGALDVTQTLAADAALWLRFSELTDLVGVTVPLAGFRRQPAQRTATAGATYRTQAEACLHAAGGQRYGAWGSRLRRQLTWHWQQRLGLRDLTPQLRYDPFAAQWRLERR